MRSRQRQPEPHFAAAMTLPLGSACRKRRPTAKAINAKKRGSGDLVEPARGIVFQGRGDAAAAGGGEPVRGVVSEGLRAVEGEIAP